MKRLLLAALLLILALVASSWSRQGTVLSFEDPYQASKDPGGGVAVPLVSQYQGLATDNVNCGPASVAAIVRALQRSPAGSADAALVATARNATGAAEGDTDLANLAAALAVFGIATAPIVAGDAPEGQADALAAIGNVIRHNRPVLALVNGADLGRGATYGDHWLVIAAINTRTGQARVVDPDIQRPRSQDWLPGGTQWLPTGQLRLALRDATADGSMAALAAGATRSRALAPAAALLPAAAVLVLWHVLDRVAPPRRGRRRRRRR